MVGKLFQFKLIERAPYLARGLMAIGRRSGCGAFNARAHSLAAPVATRMRRKGEDDVFSNGFRQIDFLTSRYFHLAREILHPDRQNEWLEAADAHELDVAGELASCKHPSVAQANVQLILYRRNGQDVRFMEVKDLIRVLPLVVFTFRRNLSYVNFHGLTLLPSRP
jgi:hypothetical protein